MNPERTKELESLATEYNSLIAQAKETYEIWNRDAVLDAHHKMAKNAIRRMDIDLDILKESWE